MTLNPGQTATLNLQFDPTVLGAAAGVLTITSNSSTNATAVISLSGTGIAHEVDLTWDAPAGNGDPVAGYNVYRSPDGGTTYQLMGSIDGNADTTYTDDAVQSGQSYDYVVKSFDDSGVESTPSNMTSVAIP
jgi:fibronectin type 3 domain-containing protein